MDYSSSHQEYQVHTLCSRSGAPAGEAKIAPVVAGVLERKKIMSLLKDRDCAIYNAHHRLINNFHLLREVLWSEKISLNEKSNLFAKVIDGIVSDIRIAYPNLSADVRNSVRPSMTPGVQCSEKALHASVENLNLILEYRRFAAEFRVMADRVSEIYERSDLNDEAKCKEMRVISDALVPIANGIGCHNDLVRMPHGGYFVGENMKSWVVSILTASDKV